MFIVDGHGSHVIDDFIYACFNSNIYLLFLPPHTSYILQPFDLFVFGPIKAHYYTAIGNLIYQSDDCPIDINEFEKDPNGEDNMVCGDWEELAGQLL